MTTVVNSPAPASDSGSSMGMIVGLILLVVIVGLFFIYGIPAMRQASTPPAINVPDKINVNIQPGTGGDGGNGQQK